MDIQLIVSDIDGTILPAGGRVSEETVQAVARCRERGTEFVIASGRWYPAALPIVKEQLGIGDGYMIVCNGGTATQRINDTDDYRQYQKQCPGVIHKNFAALQEFAQQGGQGYFGSQYMAA